MQAATDHWTAIYPMRSKPDEILQLDVDGVAVRLIADNRSRISLLEMNFPRGMFCFLLVAVSFRVCELTSKRYIEINQDLVLCVYISYIIPFLKLQMQISLNN